MGYLELDEIEQAALECVLGEDVASLDEGDRAVLVDRALQQLEPLLPAGGLAGVEAIFYRLLKDARTRFDAAANERRGWLH